MSSDGARAPRILIDRTHGGRVANVVLNRPELRNAFDDRLIEEASDVFQGLAFEPGVRVVVLSGAGKSFCAGADLNWMGRMAGYSLEENARDSAALAALFQIVNECPRPVVARIHGAALGGGTGLAAVADIVIAAEGTLFGTTEVRLGILPAVISPYVVRKIGESNARLWFLTGERFDAREAQRAGLVHRVVPEAELDTAVEAVVGSLLLGGPEALAEAKHLARTMGSLSFDAAIPLSITKISERRVSPEGQEGMSAFLGKRRASWTSAEA
ncbi:MAG: enoyl-CoA hydratase-related protein [Thermoanaerobaculia bacterium]